MDNGMYPYREPGPQQAGGAWPQPQGQIPGGPLAPQPPTPVAPVPGSGAATVSLVLGICACLLGMLGYFVHGIGMVVLVAGLGLASFICGVVGLSLSEGAGHGGRGMAGALLGAGGIALFLVLGGTAAGGLDRMLEPAPDERAVISPVGSDDDDSPVPSGTMPGRHGASAADASLSIEGRRWVGTVLASGRDTLFPAFEIAGDGSCEWCDDQLVAAPEVVPAHASVAYDDAAVSAAKAAGFDAEGLVEFWGDSGLLPEPYRIVFIGLSPDGDGTELLPAEGEAWFGYCSAMEGESADVLWASRPGDGDQQMFFVM